MSAAPDLLADLTRSGIKLTPRGDKLHVEAPRGTLTPELRKTLAERKAEILAQLKTQDSALLDRCKGACKGLSLWPTELLAALSDDDKAAVLSGDPAELKALRCFAESLAARLRTNTLPPNLNEVYEHLRGELARNPGIRFASAVLTPDTDPVLIAVAVKGAGFATYRVARERYNEGQLLEIIDRVGRARQ